MLERFEDLVGQVCSDVKNLGGDELVFTLLSGERYRLYHQQDCCETVRINDVIGELSDLIGSPVLMAEEVSNGDAPVDVEKSEYGDEGCTWTFYKLATIRGYVTIRWLGESNGYYSESVDWGVV